MPVTRATVPSHRDVLAFARARSAARPCIALLVAAGIAACASTSAPSGSAAPPAGAAPAQEDTVIRTAGDLDRVMVVGPTAARLMGYRIDWETRNVIPAGRTLQLLVPQGDAVFVLDSSNDLTRIQAGDGVRVWQAPIGDPVDRILGINRVDTPDDRVFVTVEGAMYVLDAGNGGFVSRDKLSRIANTGAVEAGRCLIYGGRTGEVVWQEFRIGHPWRVNAVDGSIRHTPLLIVSPQSADVMVASTAGVVAVMDARSARTIWTKRLLDRVSAAPAAGGGVGFVAGEDQYLWALRLADGSTLWKFFTDAPLTTAPVLLGDRVYQRIPSEGLVAFDAFQSDRPDGRKIWVNATVTGEVLARSGRNLLVWDAAGRALTLLDDRGGLVQSVNVPQVDDLVHDEASGGTIYAATRDGRIVKLVPQ